MIVRYDPETDTLTLRLTNHRIEESDEVAPGVILDLDEEGKVVGIEILRASQNGAQPQTIEYIYEKA